MSGLSRTDAVGARAPCVASGVAFRHLDLCSGIGGFALAASRVWPSHEVACFVEIDPWCRRVLKKHWPLAPQHDDLKTYDARPLSGSIDLCTAGYPCQPFSRAGSRLGTEDPRHLWPDVRRVVAEARPALCLFENVPDHFTMGLDDVLSDMEALGYSAVPLGIPACAAGAPHVRDRLWIVAHLDGERQLQREGRERFEWRRAADRSAESTGMPRPWPAEPRVVRMAHGVPDGVDRIAALGRAIVPEVAERILRAMAATLTPAGTTPEAPAGGTRC